MTIGTIIPVSTGTLTITGKTKQGKETVYLVALKSLIGKEYDNPRIEMAEKEIKRLINNIL